MKQGKIVVLSCGLGLKKDLSPFQPIVEQTDILAGSERLLSYFNPFTGAMVQLDHSVRQRCRELIEAARSGKQIAILASGDSLFNGVGATIGALADGVDISYISAPTAFQELFSRLGMPWKTAQFFSVHSGNQLPVREVLSGHLSVVYGGTTFPATEIAKAALQFLPSAGSRDVVLAENIGLENERIIRCSLTAASEISCGSLSILLLLPAKKEMEMPPLALGLEDDCFEHENGLITSSEVRVIALSKLKLPPHGVLWDVGAGSGSVGIEAAALRPNLKVFAVEKSADRINDIEKNKTLLGVANHTVICGNAVEEIQNLPTPNRIFMGGGGQDITLLMEKGFTALSPGGVMVVSALLIETLTAVLGWKPEFRVHTCSIDIATEKSLAGKYHYLKNHNRITLVSFKKEIA